VVHLIIASSRLLVQNTLSTLVWLPVLCDQRVGMYAGRAIFMLCRPSMFSSGCVRSRFPCVKRWLFRASSHIGWCQLKSPIHSVFSGLFSHCCFS
jgi:hypothetical protein